MIDQIAFVVVQVLANTINQGVQMGKCLAIKQVLIVFDLQTFPVWTGLKSLLQGRIYKTGHFHTELKTVQCHRVIGVAAIELEILS